MFRGVRLVVDTGMHAMKWSREQAVKYYVDTLGDKEASAITEIERYCVWPGQACSYMLGKLTFLAERERAQEGDGRQVRHPQIPRRHALGRRRAAEGAGQHHRPVYRRRESLEPAHQQQPRQPRRSSARLAGLFVAYLIWFGWGAMTVAHVYTVAFQGIEAREVDVQVHIGDGGNGQFNVVGLADKAVAESRERVRAALARHRPGAALQAHHRESGAGRPAQGRHRITTCPSRWACWRRWA